MAGTQGKSRGRASAAHDDVKDEAATGGEQPVGANGAEGQQAAAPTGGESNANTDGGTPAERAQTTAEDDQAKAVESRESATTNRSTNAGTAPLDPPLNGDRRPPVEGIRHLSTSPVAAAASQRSLIGQGHLGLVDDEGNTIDPDSIFDFDDTTKTYAVVQQRVHESYVQANSTTAITRLLFPAGARIPRDRAQAFVDAAKAEAENPLSAAPGVAHDVPIPGEQHAESDSLGAAEGADSK